MTSKEALNQLYIMADTPELAICIQSCYDIVEKDLEVLEILKNTGAIELLFGEEPYCNYDFTDIYGNVIDLDYDEKAPTLEITTKELKTIKEWLKNDK